MYECVITNYTDLEIYNGPHVVQNFAYIYIVAKNGKKPYQCLYNNTV